MYPYLFILLVCTGCFKERKQKPAERPKVDWIYRHHNEYYFSNLKQERRIREKYPWEEQYIGAHLKITKDYFRCRGNPLNPMKTALNEAKVLFDCGGGDTHSLPIRKNREFIYPILIELLNEVQLKTEKKVMITCAHRCPVHNLYVDSSIRNQSSKHQIGAEVDFYVEGMQDQPFRIVSILMEYFHQRLEYEGNKEYLVFKRYEGQTDVSILPWFNKEVFIKLYKAQEGRDLDNSHPYPYISIQVRFDREESKPVTYNWHQAFNGYRRS